MPVLVTAQVENQTETLCDGKLSASAPQSMRAEGWPQRSVVELHSFVTPGS